MTGTPATPDGDAPLADRAYRAAAAAYLAAPHGWQAGVHAALAEVLDLLAREEEETVRCSVLATPTLAGMTERNRLVERFAGLLGPRTEATDVARPDILAEAVGESVLELIGSYVAERRVGELPDALPTATLLALTPFVGSDAAEELAGSASDQRR
ncbi:MAG: hypothetical protein GXY03_01030 [Solirubrobacterales bacterium]|nr:hypothetical protein [Solirubrobacterales bacterium]